MPLENLSPDMPTIQNANGGRQSRLPYRCDLLPPEAVLAVAGVLHDGALKYGDNNWRAISVAEHINHGLTHLFAYAAEDLQDDHLEHAACRILMALEIAICEADSSLLRPYMVPDHDESGHYGIEPQY